MPHGLPDFWQGTIAGMPTIGAGQVAWYQSDAALVGDDSHEDLINYVVPDTFELHVCSGVVSCDFPMLQKYDLRQTPAGSWVNPTGHRDPDDKWINEEAAYDGDLTTGAAAVIPVGDWTPYLELLINETNINKIRFLAGYGLPYASTVNVWVYYGGEWVEVYSGAFTRDTWVEKPILLGTQLVSKARIRFATGPGLSVTVRLYEFQFNTHEVTPQKGTWFDTHSIIPYLPQAPYIVEPGATFAVRVYNDDLVDHNMSTALAGFLQQKTM